jgi:hypothetical protein
LPDQAAINIRIPEDPVAVLEQPFVCRAKLGAWQSGPVAEGAIQHVSDVEELVPQEGQKTLLVQEPPGIQPDADRSSLRLSRPLPAGGNEEFRALVPASTGVDDDACTGTGQDQRLLPKRLPDRPPQVKTLKPGGVKFMEGSVSLLRIHDLVETVAFPAEAHEPSALGGSKNGLLDEPRFPLDRERIREA